MKTDQNDDCLYYDPPLFRQCDVTDYACIVEDSVDSGESVVTCIKSCLIFQIPRFMLVTEYRFIFPLNTLVNSSFILKVNCYYLKIQITQVDNNTPI